MYLLRLNYNFCILKLNLLNCYNNSINLDQCWGFASRLPSDSRIPKSSSVPEKMASSQLINNKPSKQYFNSKVVAPTTINKKPILNMAIDHYRGILIL